MAILSQGSIGVDVLSLQKMLRVLGYDTEENGIFGSMTKAAVLHFQSANGLNLDGVVGPETMSALRMAISPGTVPAPMSKPIPYVSKPILKIPSLDLTGYYKYAIYGLGAVFTFLIIKRLFTKRK